MLGKISLHNHINITKWIFMNTQIKALSLAVLSSISINLNAANYLKLHDRDTWTGFYAGGSLGMVKHTSDVTDNNAALFLATIKESTNPKLAGGFQLGYRRQLIDEKISGIYGLEFSGNYASANFKQQYGSDYALFEVSATSNYNASYLLELIGGINTERSMLFLGAGLSWSSLKNSMTSVASIPYFTSFSTDKYVFGTVLSGGVEYALYKNLSARFKVDVISPNNYSVLDSLDNSFQISNLLVQGLFGINYQFC